jgi:antitoxin component of RelBE/YafQ-DinJ toxin-antitoxin module
MSYKIQVTVDEKLNRLIKARADQMGLSVSSYTRLALMTVLPRKSDTLLDQALKEIRSKDLEALTLDQFNHQLDHL